MGNKITNRDIIRRLKSIVFNKAPKSFLTGEDNFLIIIPEEILYLRKEGSGVYFYFHDGTRQKTIEPIGDVKKKFDDCPNFVSGDELSLINTDYLKQSTYEYGEHKVYFSNSDIIARVTSYNAKEIAKVISVPSLRWCNGYKRIMAVCQSYNIRHFLERINSFSNDRLIKEFSDSSGNLVTSTLLYNLIWQIYNRIINNELSEDEILMGNIRSFWYTYFKPVLAILNMVNEKFYGDMIEAFTKFTVDWKLFKYKDWNFLDIKRYNKKIGEKKRIYLLKLK